MNVWNLVPVICLVELQKLISSLWRSGKSQWIGIDEN